MTEGQHGTTGEQDLAPWTRARRVDVRGLALRTLELGPDDARAPLAVLLHGWLDHARSFDLLAPLLAADGRARVVALDQRGHGDSAWVGPGGFYHFVEYLADLDGLLDALAPAGPVRLVGHSMGAAVALLYAATRPERVVHATLLDGQPIAVEASDVPGRVVEYLDTLRTNGGAVRRRRRAGTVEEAAERLRSHSPALRPEAARHLAETGTSPDPAQGGALAWKWDPLLRAHSPLPFIDQVVDRMSAAVAAPLLLLRGARGFLPAEDKLQRRFASLRVEVGTVQGTGHHLHLEEPGEVARRVLASWEALDPACYRGSDGRGDDESPAAGRGTPR